MSAFVCLAGKSDSGTGQSLNRDRAYVQGTMHGSGPVTAAQPPMRMPAAPLQPLHDHDEGTSESTATTTGSDGEALKGDGLTPVLAAAANRRASHAALLNSCRQPHAQPLPCQAPPTTSLLVTSLPPPRGVQEPPAWEKLLQSSACVFSSVV
jgi:hypothetical protein